MPEKPNKLMPALYGGIIIGIISGIPFLSFVNCLCCAGVLFGGVMAVFFYKKDLPPDNPMFSNSDAMALGALAGVFGALIANVITGILYYTVGNVAGKAIYDMVMGFYESAGILDQMPPEAVEQMEQSMMETGLSITSIVVSFIIYPLFGLLGGLIGYAMFKPKAQPPVAPHHRCRRTGWQIASLRTHPLGVTKRTESVIASTPLVRSPAIRILPRWDCWDGRI